MHSDTFVHVPYTYIHTCMYKHMRMVTVCGEVEREGFQGLDHGGALGTPVLEGPGEEMPLPMAPVAPGKIFPPGRE